MRGGFFTADRAKCRHLYWELKLSSENNSKPSLERVNDNNKVEDEAEDEAEHGEDMAAEQLRAQHWHITTIMSKEHNGTTRFRGVTGVV